MTIARFKDLVLDATDATRLGVFWGQVLDRQWHARVGGDGWLSGARCVVVVYRFPSAE
jgi:hypothetical protein